MTIWILAVLLFGIVGALGRQVGGIRMGISLAGVIVALFVAGPLAPFVRKALSAVGAGGPITVWMLAAPLAFLAVMLIFNSIAMAVYLKFSGYYLHRAPDDVRMRWQRLDAGMGLSAGLLAAVIYLIAASAYIYHLGYVTTQLESPNENPVWLKVVNKLREDLASSQFDRVAAGVTTASPELYQAADVLGLLYHNRELQSRLPEYPLFMSLTEVPDLVTAFTNETFGVLLPAKTNVSLIIKDPSFEQILAHPEIQRVTKELDLPDLLNYLKTGNSPKYASEPLVGRWQIDIKSTVLQFARNTPGTTVLNQNRLSYLLRLRMSDYLILVTPDEKLFVKGKEKPIGNFATLLANRFVVQPLPTTVPTNAPPTLFTGTWKKEGDKYQISISADASGKAAEGMLIENGKKLVVSMGNNALVFVK